MKIFYVDRFKHVAAEIFDYLQDISILKHHEVYFIGPEETNENYSSNKYQKFIKRIWKFDNYVMNIYNYTKIQKPDVICFNFEYRIFGSLKSTIKFPLLLFLINRTKSKIVVILHQFFVYREGRNWKFFQDDYPFFIPRFLLKIFIHIFIRIICSLSDKIVVYTPAAKLSLVEYYGIKPDKIDVNRLAISSNTNPVNQNNEFKFKKQFLNKKIILCFGLISPRKGLEHAIKSMKTVVDKLPDHILVISGASRYYESYEKMLHQLTKQLELENKVIFTGFLDDDEVKILFNMAESVLYLYNPSVSGTYAVLHAIHHNKPTILTNVDTFNGLIGKNAALFIESNDELELANAILKLATNSDLRNNLTEQMKLISNNCTLEKTAFQYMNLFENLIK